MVKRITRAFRNVVEKHKPSQREVPVGFHRPPSINEMIALYVRNEVSRRAAEAGYETFEEADDFDVGEEDQFESPYEVEFDPLTGKEVYKQERRIMDEAGREFDAMLSQRQKAQAERKRKAKAKVKSESTDGPIDPED